MEDGHPAVEDTADRTDELRSQPARPGEAQLHVVLVGASAGLSARAAVLGCERLARAGPHRQGMSG